MIPSTSLAVRDASSRDSQALSVLLAQLGYPLSPPLVVARLANLAAGGLTRVLVADAGAGAIGLLALTRLDILPYPDPIARITALCVAEGSRGAGVGGVLVERAAEISRGWGCEKIEVASNRRRVRAHDFYQHHGYEETHRCFVKRLRRAEQSGDADVKC